ncbi:tetratricopeptide repeat protein [Fulvivirgaceae bacterium BMA12]|uniref:Tetratricopeptide repeat protein n=1 Tax=Agaribacillus aureus TaxID=3051825 RepID=A0ABT8LD86_9BACT|nr:tetratricopeptide repeat protein [Fulvivirgaceae bacterium BMA12]
MTVQKNIGFLILVMVFGFTANTATAQKSKRGALNDERRRIASEKNFIEGQKYFVLEDYTKALGYFMHALETNPDNPTIHYKIGEIYLKNEEYQKAEEFAAKALELNKENKYYFLLVGQIYNKQSRYAEAAKIYEEMIAAIPSSKEYLFDLASIYLYDNQLDNAINTYERAEKLFGKLPEITYAKQKVYLKQNKLGKAIEEGKELVDSYPGEGSYVINLAQILISNNRYDEAIEYLEAVDEDNASYSNSRLLLSDIYRKNGDNKKSKSNLKIVFENPELNIDTKIQLLAGFMSQLPDKEVEEFTHELARKLEKSHPDDANAYIIYGDFLLKTGKKEEAINKYSKALELDNSNFNVWLNILQIEWELNKMDALLAHSEEALEIFPNQAIIYFYNGTSKVVKKNYEQATEVLEYGKKLAKKDDNLTGAFNGQLGMAYSALKEYEKSDAAFDAALEQDPNNFVILNNYSFYLAVRKEKLELAKKMSTRLVKENPDDAMFLDTHAWVLYMMKEYKDARKYLEKALKSGKPNGSIIEHYGDVLFRLGEKDRAIEQWEKAKKLDGNSEFIDKKIADRKLYE